MAEDCVYNSMLKASCVHFLGSQTCTSNKTAIDLTSRGRVIGKVSTNRLKKTVFRRNFGLWNRSFW